MSTPDLVSLLPYNGGNNNYNAGTVVSAYYGNYTYKYVRSETISNVLYYIYDTHDSNGNLVGVSTDANAVKVVASDITDINNWSDYGTDLPGFILFTGGKMEFMAGTYLMFRCDLPTNSSGGGTGTPVLSGVKKVFCNFW